MAGSGDVVIQHIEAFNDRDRDAEPFAADAEMVAPGATVTGRDEVLGFLGVFQEAFPDGRLEVKQLLVDGSSAAVEGVFAGTHDGVLHTPDGDVAATGKPVEFRWAAVYEVSDHQLASEHLYFDQADLLGQLGLLPD
jgi:predicted ester cyclase